MSCYSYKEQLYARDDYKLDYENLTISLYI